MCVCVWSNAWEKHSIHLLSAGSDVSWVNPGWVNPLIKKKKKKNLEESTHEVKWVSFSFSLSFLLTLHTRLSLLSIIRLRPSPPLSAPSATIGDVTHRTPPADRHRQRPPSKNRPAERHPRHQITVATRHLTKCGRKTHRLLLPSITRRTRSPTISLATSTSKSRARFFFFLKGFFFCLL
jgi:hypothetical protein